MRSKKKFFEAKIGHLQTQEVMLLKPKITIWKLKLAIWKLKLAIWELTVIILKPKVAIWKLTFAIWKLKIGHLEALKRRCLHRKELQNDH